MEINFNMFQSTFSLSFTLLNSVCDMSMISDFQIFILNQVVNMYT